MIGTSRRLLSRLAATAAAITLAIGLMPMAAARAATIEGFEQGASQLGLAERRGKSAEDCATAAQGMIGDVTGVTGCAVALSNEESNVDDLTAVYVTMDETSARKVADKIAQTSQEDSTIVQPIGDGTHGWHITDSEAPESMRGGGPIISNMDVYVDGVDVLLLIYHNTRQADATALAKASGFTAAGGSDATQQTAATPAPAPSTPSASSTPAPSAATTAASPTATATTGSDPGQKNDVAGVLALFLALFTLVVLTVWLIRQPMKRKKAADQARALATPDTEYTDHGTTGEEEPQSYPRQWGDATQSTAYPGQQDPAQPQYPQGPYDAPTQALPPQDPTGRA